MWNILVVDDNPANCELLVEILAEHAHCHVAHSGAEAMDSYNASLESGHAYDAILLDIAMPEVDGITFLNFVRDKEKSAGILIGEGILIIMVTAFEKPFMQAFSSGCDDYVLKPVDGNQLLNKIRRKLAFRRKP